MAENRSDTAVESAFKLAHERYAQAGVDVEKPLQVLQSIAVSVNCWQGDDVGGFEHAANELGSGLAVTGN